MTMLLAIASAVYAAVPAVELDINNDGLVEGLEVFIGDVILLSLFIGAVIVIWKAFAAGKKFTGNIDRFFSDWSGEPERDGVPERPGILARMKTLEDLRDNQTKILEELSGQMTVLSKHVNQELNRNGGSSTKDAAHEALRVAQEIKKQQEKEADARLAWHQRYQNDQENIKKEWGAVFVAIATMIPKTPEEQMKIWADITKSYGDGTILETHPVPPADPDLLLRP